jgi:Putative MetA-pathway of phenol degradation
LETVERECRNWYRHFLPDRSGNELKHFTGDSIPMFSGAFRPESMPRCTYLTILVALIHRRLSAICHRFLANRDPSSEVGRNSIRSFHHGWDHCRLWTDVLNAWRCKVPNGDDRGRWCVVLFCMLFVAESAQGVRGQEISGFTQTFPGKEMSQPAKAVPDVDQVFADPGTTQPFNNATPSSQGSSSGYPRRMPWGNGHIMIADPADFPRIKAFDVHAPGRFLDNMRPNMFGVPVEDEWDFYNLINTDRPDFTDATYSVGRGVTVIESGYTFRRSNTSDLHLSNRTLPETLVRVGLTDEFELRVKWNGYVMSDVTDEKSGLTSTSFGGSDLMLGFKYELLQQNDWRPMVTFVGGSYIPTGTGGVSANQVQPFANFVLGWGFRRWLYLKASTGVDFVKSNDVTHVITGSLQEGPLALQGLDNSSQWHQSVSLLFQATKRVGGFVEWFSFFSNNADDNRAQHFVDTGLYFYVTPNVQLDIRIGDRISNRVDGMFSGMGFSVRF